MLEDEVVAVEVVLLEKLHHTPEVERALRDGRPRQDRPLPVLLELVHRLRSLGLLVLDPRGLVDHDEALVVVDEVSNERHDRVALKGFDIYREHLQHAWRNTDRELLKYSIVVRSPHPPRAPDEGFIGYSAMYRELFVDPLLVHMVRCNNK